MCSADNPTRQRIDARRADRMAQIEAQRAARREEIGTPQERRDRWRANRGANRGTSSGRQAGYR